MFTRFAANLVPAIAALFFVAGCASGAAGLFQEGSGSSSTQEAGSATTQEAGSVTQESGSAEAGSATQEAGSVEAGSGEAGSETMEPNPALLDPSLANEQAPATYRVQVETTKGAFILECVRAQSPNGADRFYNMVKIGYFKDIAIFRAIEGFMFQFGIHGDPEISAKWSESNIQDDPNAGFSNTPGTITFAKTGAPNSRSTQLFINLGENGGLDRQGFTPFGAVVQGMDIVRSINTEYGENRRGDNVQGNLKARGNEFVKTRFPNIDYITSITLVETPAPAPGG